MSNKTNFQKTKDTQFIIIDGDFSLYDCQITKELGWGYGLNELNKAIKDVCHLSFGRSINHFSKLHNGIKGAKEVKKIANSDPINGDAYGLQRFYEILTENNLGTKEEMYSFAKDAIKKHQICGAKELINKWYPEHAILATIAGSTAAEAAKYYFGFRKIISNIDRFDENGNLEKVELVILNGEDKLEAVEKMLNGEGWNLENGLVIGDNRYDKPLLELAGVPCASPYATSEIKDLVRSRDGILVKKSYMELLNN